MIKTVAKFFRGVHRAIGITDLPPDATPEQERNFALMWIGIILFIFVWTLLVFGMLFYLF